VAQALESPEEQRQFLQSLGFAPDQDVGFDVTVGYREGERSRLELGSTLAGPFPASSWSLPLIAIQRPGSSNEGAEDLADLQLLRTLGEGGMGEVHLARQRSLARDVAVKTARAGADAALALLQEAITAGSLEHPGIVPVHALGRDATGQPVLVMKRIEGVAWRELVRDPQHAAWSRFTGATEDRLGFHLNVLVQVSNAIHFAHTRGLIHRDIKPENVMVGDFGEVYLVDWGTALSVAGAENGTSGSFVGTPAYAAPEMLDGEKLDARTDVYLLGATLHEILTRRTRHAGKTLFEVLQAARLSAPPTYDDEVPRELAELCQQATARDRTKRPATAAVFRQAVTDYLRHRSSIALCASAHQRLGELISAIGGQTGARADAARVYRLLSETRFGFEQALREWKDNIVAHAGLAACTKAMVEFEIARRDPRAARALLQELADPAPALLAAVETLELNLDQERARAGRLSELEHDLDMSVSSKQRTRFLLFLALLMTATWVYASWQSRNDTQAVTPGVLLMFALVGLVLMSGVTYLARRRLLVNVANRRIVGMFFVAIVGLIVHRALRVTSGLVVSQILVDDLLLFATASGSAAVCIDARGSWLVAIFVLAAFAAAQAPAYAVTLFGAASLLSLSLGVLFWTSFSRPR
jgi:eukaryotic-like serine/threonine-protein kinase